MKKAFFVMAAIITAVGSIMFYSCATDQSKAAGSDSSSVVADKPEDAIKKGEHLVAIMGCQDCHSPKKMGANGPEIIAETMLSGYPADRPVVKFDSKMIKEGFGMFYPDLTAAAGPWGVSFAANLTPDSTGIGNWTEDQFKIALTQGKSKGLPAARNLLPPMPWPNYANLTDEEVHAIFSYLKSIKPVSNIVPQPVTPDKM